MPNSSREAGYNMRFYAWIFALFNIAIGVIVGIQTKADRRLRAWAAWLAVAGASIGSGGAGRMSRPDPFTAESAL